MEPTADEWPFSQVRRPARPGRQPTLSAAEVVRAAVAVADAEGPEAVSMRRIARELGSGVMSIYWHVSSKEELLDLMIDALTAEMPVPDPSGDWRRDLRAAACGVRACLLRHTWAMDFLAGRPPTGPHGARNVERSLALLDGLKLDIRRTMDVLGTVMTYVLGCVLREVQEMRGDQERAKIENDMAPEQIKAEHARIEAWFRASGEFPHVMQLFDEDIDPDSPDTRDERFEFGLDCLLDGIAARLTS